MEHDIELKTNSKGRWYTEEELIKELREMDAVLAGGDPYNSKVIESANKLKIIARIGVGHDNVDLTAATRKGIYVTWTPIPELAKAVADETFALILSVLRRVPHADRQIRRGEYDIEGVASDVTDAYPLTLGIIGIGRIGSEVAKRGIGFGMKILYHDIMRRKELEKELNLEYSSLHELLTNSDIVTIHTPLNPKTRGLIGEKEISMMKNETILVNTARGPIIQENALYRALIKGQLGGAGLSVLSEEPPTSDSPFYKLGEKLPNVVLFPHIGAGRNTGRIMALTAVKDVIAVMDGKRPRYVLNKQILNI